MSMPRPRPITSRDGGVTWHVGEDDVPPKPKLHGVGEFLAFVVLIVGLGAALITFLVFCWWLVMGMVR